MLASRSPPVTITPNYLVKTKTAVDLDQPAIFTQRTYSEPTNPSFHHFQEELTLKEIKETVVQTWPGNPSPFMSAPPGSSQTQEELLKALPTAQAGGRPYEFPNGFNTTFTSDRYRIAETLFDPRAFYSPPPDTPSGPYTEAPQPSHLLPALIKSSLSNVDVDLRPHLLTNVVVTGGTSLLHGLNDRLNMELAKMYPSSRIKIHSPGNLAERRFGSWIGGSIMASLGTFHQMWISRKEYEEHGAGIVEKRCK